MPWRADSPYQECSPYTNFVSNLLLFRILELTEMYEIFIIAQQLTTIIQIKNTTNLIVKRNEVKRHFSLVY